MKNGGHNQHTYPFDKFLPRSIARLRSQVLKRVQKKKQRQHDRKLEKQLNLPSQEGLSHKAERIVAQGFPPVEG